MKRFISIILMVMMLCSMFAMPASAEENQSRASAYFSSYGINLTEQSDGRIKIVFSATGTGVCSQLGVATYQVEMRDSDGSWDDCTGLLSGKTGSNVTSYSFSKYFTPVPGNCYRVNCTFVCSINGGMESKGYTSGTICV